jgi:hypothetical protein
VMKPLKRVVHILHVLSASTTLHEDISLVRRVALVGIYSLDASSIAIPPYEGDLRSFCHPAPRTTFSVFMCVPF